MGAKLFGGNLNPRTTKAQLMRFFSVAGRVESISVPVDRDTNQPRGFCFVEFADRATAEKAVVICDGGELDGRKLRISWAHERDNGSGDRRARRQRDPRVSFAGDGTDEPEVIGGGREPRVLLALECEASGRGASPPII